MKIVMLAGYYPPDVKGGGEISTQLLAEILTAAGCEVQVLTCGEKEKIERLNGIQVQRILSPNVFWDFKAHKGKLAKLNWHLHENSNSGARRRLQELLSAAKPDLLITSTIENFGGEGWTAAHLAAVPSVHILRSYYPFCYRGNAVRAGVNCPGQCLDCRILSSGRKRASRYVDGVVGISQYVLERHERHGFFPNAKAAVIGEPISRASFHPRDGLSQPVRFGYLGVLSADKGLESLAQAWRTAGLSECSLTIAGRGKDDYVHKIKEMFPSDVAFRGWVDSSEYLDTVDFLVVPSVWNEPFGRIVIEAFARGVPVIGSRIGGIAETITKETGFLYEPGQSVELAQLLRQCSQISASAFLARSRKASLEAERYESVAIASAHKAFYAQVIDTFHSQSGFASQRILGSFPTADSKRMDGIDL